MAVALAASSLFLCKWILILCNDLTCFVAQMTGMTMWWVIWETFLTALGGFFGMFVQWDIRYVINPGEMFARVTLAGILVLLLMIMMIWLFLKVLFGMLMRIALLALLIVFAPLAFAFYASEDTAHWTKTWVSMFFGTAFQQIAALVVIYGGGNLIGACAGSESGSLTGFLTGMILGLLVLVAADKIVNIVNPTWGRGSGIFSGFGAMVGMAATAAVMIATAGAGAVIGPAAAGAARGGTAAVGGVSQGAARLRWAARAARRGAGRGLQWGANINNFANQLQHGRIDAHAFAPARRRRDQIDRFNQEIDRQISRGRQSGGGGSNS